LTAELVVGADIGGTKIKYVVSDATGLSVLQDEIATNPDDPVASLERLACAIQENLPRKTGNVTAVGVACAGIVSQRVGKLGRSPNLPGWENIALVELIGSAFSNLPTLIANDVNAALFGEFRLGAGRSCQNLIMLALGTGVGGGVIVNGRLLTGAADGAGEIGHMVLDPTGPRCGCGNRGCLEAYAGGVALIRRARELINSQESLSSRFVAKVEQQASHLTTADLYQLARDGDVTAGELFHDAGLWLGQAVANLVNVLDPDRVIIGGGVAQAGDRARDEPGREVDSRTDEEGPGS